MGIEHDSHITAFTCKFGNMVTVDVRIQNDRDLQKI